MKPSAGAVNVSQNGAVAARPADDMASRIGLARQATERRDWLQATRLWDDVRTRWPTQQAAHLGTANALRELGRVDEAEQVIAAAILLSPDNEHLAVAFGWSANARRDWQTAISRWQDVRSRFPDNPAGYLGGGNALRANGELAAADTVLGDAVARFPDHERITIAFASMPTACRDWSSAVIRWRTAREKFPENPSCYVGEIGALRNAGEAELAEPLFRKAAAALAIAKERGMAPAAALAVELELARCREDWTSVRSIAEGIIAINRVPGPHVFLPLAQACLQLGDDAAADHAAKQALDADPKLHEALLIQVSVATKHADSDRAIALYRKLAALNPTTVRWSLKLVQMLNVLGKVQEAVAEFTTIYQQWPDDPLVKIFMRNFAPRPQAKDETFPASLVSDIEEELLPEEDELRTLGSRAPGPELRCRPLMSLDPEKDVLIAEVAGAKSALLVFTGGTDAVSLPLAIFDRYLAAIKVTTIYLKDFQRLRYLSGVQSLGNNYETTLDALRLTLKDLGITRLFTIGNCAGGFGAIRYGVALAAERIITFGAVTHQVQTPLSRLEQGYHFAMKRLAERFPPETTDLKPFLESRPYTSKIDLFYDQEYERDCLYALHLSGLPGITLHPQTGPGKQRRLRRVILANQDFSAMFAGLLGLGTA